ncbi:hypothetical protein KC363_g5867 [Hortaea werneckii]|nr:hypothetical protein KC325_g7570 [Hortaea werneckii]KAI6988160.1 hypothetical protein KC359_g7895 [Hortaea werneckii]KAI7142272.1 hypothetical protein KC344_g7341 [Hortaea werneckii]KAI7169279.1 hypothetical protein KC360_g7586 [Hortaea werneckii]KAI7187655.1 hypothetical protein KC363_g5867 [Hortaea werneckii]
MATLWLSGLDGLLEAADEAKDEKLDGVEVTRRVGTRGLGVNSNDIELALIFGRKEDVVLGAVDAVDAGEELGFEEIFVDELRLILEVEEEEMVAVLLVLLVLVTDDTANVEEELSSDWIHNSQLQIPPSLTAWRSPAVSTIVRTKGASPEWLAHYLHRNLVAWRNLRSSLTLRSQAVPL